MCIRDSEVGEVLLDLGLLLLRDGNQGLVEGVVVLGVLWMDEGEEKTKSQAERQRLFGRRNSSSFACVRLTQWYLT